MKKSYLMLILISILFSSCQPDILSKYESYTRSKGQVLCNIANNSTKCTYTMVYDNNKFCVYKTPKLDELLFEYRCPGTLKSFTQFSGYLDKEVGTDDINVFVNIVHIIVNDGVNNHLLLFAPSVPNKPSNKPVFDIKTNATQTISSFVEKEEYYTLCSNEDLDIVIYDGKGNITYEDSDNNIAFSRTGIHDNELCGYDGSSIGLYKLYSNKIEKVHSKPLGINGKPSYDKMKLSVYNTLAYTLTTGYVYDQGKLFVYDTNTNEIVLERTMEDVKPGLMSVLFPHKDGNLFVSLSNDKVFWIDLFNKPSIMLNLTPMLALDFSPYELYINEYDGKSSKILGMFMPEENQLRVNMFADIPDKIEYMLFYRYGYYLYSKDKVYLLTKPDFSLYGLYRLHSNSVPFKH